MEDTILKRLQFFFMSDLFFSGLQHHISRSSLVSNSFILELCRSKRGEAFLVRVLFEPKILMQGKNKKKSWTLNQAEMGSSNC